MHTSRRRRHHSDADERMSRAVVEGQRFSSAGPTSTRAGAGTSRELDELEPTALALESKMDHVEARARHVAAVLDRAVRGAPGSRLNHGLLVRPKVARFDSGGRTMNRSMKGRGSIAAAVAMLATGLLAAPAGAHGTCADHQFQVLRGEPDYSPDHDVDEDGIGCESLPSRGGTPPPPPPQPFVPPPSPEPVAPQPQPPAPRFSDIGGDTHSSNIEAFAALGIGMGYPDGTFRPIVPVTRGQMASFLSRALDLPEGRPGAFADVAGSVHERAIGAIADAGVTSGYRDGRFGPDDLVTRAQMATFLVAAFDLPPGSVTFPDVSGVHAASVSAIASAGITSGYPDGTFRPDQPVTRGQMATFILASLERSGGAPVPPAER